MPIYREELSPVNFLERAGEAYADRVAVVDGEIRYTWAEFRKRSRRFATALRSRGLLKGDRVAFLAVNSEPALLAHFAVPQAGGVLVAINTRLSEEEIAYIVEQSGSCMVFVTPGLEPLLNRVPPEIVRVTLADEFENLLESGTEGNPVFDLEDEYELISINYTSGTTGLPKGVMFHHRGAFLNALALALDHRLTLQSRYLWTLPMFHCNGWTFPWSLAAVGACSVCIPRVDPPRIWEHFRSGVTHFCAAPTVLTMLVNDPTAARLTRPVRAFTAGAPPSPTLIGELASLNFELEHVYGLTETYGPYTMNIPPLGSDELSAAEQARLRSQQGFPNVCANNIRVVDREMKDVEANGEQMGEVVMRGNLLMKGYFRDPQATAEAFEGGWFHSGDIAVQHPNGSIELQDRKKDILISGGENISTVEIEQAVVSHPSVMECAVIAVPHEKWGEVPKAFVTLKPSTSLSVEELIAHCRTRIAGFKIPKEVEFGPLPKTATGKIQKYVLRKREWKGREKRIN